MLKAPAKILFSPEKIVYLSRKQIDIYLYQVDNFFSNLLCFQAILSTNEIRRAQRFRFRKDQNRFIICRSLLRQILSQYIEILPEKIFFEYNYYGKPFLNISQNPENFQFNLSHSGNMAAIGVVKGIEIGVDIEEIKEINGMEDIIKRYGSKEEYEIYQSCTKCKKAKTFYRWFTRKEAWGKAHGFGFQAFGKINSHSLIKTILLKECILSISLKEP